MSSGTKGIKQIVKKIRRLGFTVKLTKKNHYVCYTRQGPYFFSSSPSNPWSIRLTIQGLKRRGIDVLQGHHQKGLGFVML